MRWRERCYKENTPMHHRDTCIVEVCIGRCLSNGQATVEAHVSIAFENWGDRCIWFQNIATNVGISYCARQFSIINVRRSPWISLTYHTEDIDGVTSYESQGKSRFMSGSGDLPAIVGIIIAMFTVSVKPWHDATTRCHSYWTLTPSTLHRKKALATWALHVEAHEEFSGFRRFTDWINFHLICSETIESPMHLLDVSRIQKTGAVRLFTFTIEPAIPYYYT